LFNFIGFNEMNKVDNDVHLIHKPSGGM